MQRSEQKGGTDVASRAKRFRQRGHRSCTPEVFRDGSALLLASGTEDSGAGDRDRTGDIDLGKVAFYH